MTFSLATDLFAHLQRLSVLFHTRRQVGDLIARVTGDTWCVNTMVTDAIVPAIQALVTLVAMFAVMWQLQPTLTLLALGVAPFFLIVIKVLGGPIKDRNREQRDLEGSMMSVVEQSLSSVPGDPGVHARGPRGPPLSRPTPTGPSSPTCARRSPGCGSSCSPGLITTIGTAGVIYVGADLALRGELTPGTIIVFLSYLVVALRAAELDRADRADDPGRGRRGRPRRGDPRDRARDHRPPRRARRAHGAARSASRR